MKCGRRKFIKSIASSAIVFPSIVRSDVLGLGGSTPPSEKITLGFIGTGIHGVGVNLRMFLNVKDAQVVSLCDVDKRKLSRPVAACNAKGVNIDKSHLYQDFREILADKSIDAVVISTPDHWHVPMSMMAMASGKDVFSEKPTYCIDEGRVLANAVKKTGRVYMAGIEDRAMPQYKRLAELVRLGVIGDVERIFVRVQTRLHENIPYKKEEIPSELNFDMFVGPAPETEYQTELMKDWRFNTKFGLGPLLDWGVHMFDTAQIAIGQDMKGPTKVVPIRSKFLNIKDGILDGLVDFKIQFNYDNGAIIEVAGGGETLRAEGSKGWIEVPKWNAKLNASSAKILTHVIEAGEFRINSEPMFEQCNFIDCVRNRKTPFINCENHHRLSTALGTGFIAAKLARTVNWDYKTESFINDQEANNMKYRQKVRGDWCNYKI